MKRKILSVILAFAMIIGFMPTMAFANGDSTGPTEDSNTALVSAIETFLDGASESNHTMTLTSGVTWPDATPVYWKAETKTEASAENSPETGFAATLKEALTAAYKANKNDITIVCKPSADVGAMTHGHVADNLTIYGNNAYLDGGECDLEVDKYKYSRSTGAQASTDDAKYLDKEITITAYELDNLGVWAERNTAHTININLNDCDGKAIEGKTKVQRVYLTGTSGINNITLTGCDFITTTCPVYSNADGSIAIKNCSFSNVCEPINLKHKGTGMATYRVENSTFTNCGSTGDDKAYAAPIRFVSDVADGKVSAVISGCSFSGTIGANGDILLGDGRPNEPINNVFLTIEDAGSETTVVAQRTGYYNADKTVADQSKVRTIKIAQGDSITTSSAEMFVVAAITNGDATTYYDTLAEAVEAVNDEGTIELIKDVTIASSDRLTIDTDKTFTIDLGGNTLTGRTDIKHGNVTIKNGTVTNEYQPLNVYGSTDPTAKNYSVLTISEDVNVSAEEKVVCMMKEVDTEKTYGAVINLEGNVTATGSGTDAAVFVSGNIGNTDSDVDIDAMSENNIVNVTGTITGGDIMAIAMSGQATVNVESSAKISGSTGIGVKRGILNVEDGATVEATGEKLDPVIANMNGAENTGAAISVTSSYNKYGSIGVNINGGTIKSANNVAFYVGHSEEDGDLIAFTKGMSVSLADGNFAGGEDGAVFVADKIAGDADSYSKAIVSGGVFSSDPTAYCVSGKTGKASGNKDYPFTVGDVQKEVKVEAAQTEVKVAPITDDTKTEEATAINNAAKKVADTTASGLEAAASAEASEITDEKVNEAKRALETELKKVDNDATVETVNIYVQPYLDITVADAKVETTSGDTPTTTVKELTLDIKPMVKTIASTATTAEDIVTKADVQEGKTQNAVELGEAKETTVTTPVTITIPLPSGFLSGVEHAGKLYIKHQKSADKTYVYTANVTDDGTHTDGSSTNYYATFTNPNGFSTFVLTATDTRVAEINGVGYETLQAAVNAVEDGGTITVVNDVTEQSATVGKTISFQVALAGDVTTNFTTDKIKAGTRTSVEVTDTEGAAPYNYNFVYKRSSSGGSSTVEATTYDISVPSSIAHGSVSLSKTSAAENDKVTLTVKADKGYTLEVLKATDASGKEVELTAVKLGEEYTFVMPASKVSFEVSFMEDNSMLNYFVDVNAADYFYDAVLWAAEKNITTGVDDLHFAPEGDCTRAQIVTFLWRAAGSPEVTTDKTFSDVAADSYYAKAVAWAVANGITTGTEADKFSPDDTCTRAQSVTFLARALKGTAEATADFIDVAADSYYASAVAWAKANGITTGVSESSFGPDNDCTRAQIVTFLYRAYEAK